MDKKEINKLLKDLYYHNDVIAYDKIYYYMKNYVEKSSKYLIDRFLTKKDIYTDEEIIEQVFLEFFLESTSEKIRINSIEEFRNIFINIIFDIIIQLNY